MTNTNQPIKVVVITAAVTALVTIIVSTWLPNLFTKAYDWASGRQLLVVEVSDGAKPVEGVKLSVTPVTTGVVQDHGITDSSGRLTLRNVSVGMFSVEAVYEEGPNVRKYGRVHTVEALPNVIRLDLKDFPFQPTVVASAPPAHPIATPILVPPSAPSPAPSEEAKPSDIRYGSPLLTADRKVQAVLEIDSVEGTSLPPLEVSTRAGTIKVEDIFKELGIDLEIVRNGTVPKSVLGPDETFNNDELKFVMRTYMNAVRPGKWHFYIVVAPRATIPTSSFMFDSAERKGAAILTEYNHELGLSDSRYADPRALVFQVIHEMGHMLNLPHPWQAYGDTKSVMSYPYRWTDWSWDDPQVYNFDEFGQKHIRRAPDMYVMPGGSSFLNYGAPVSWMASQ
ncbi:MAG TPA: hypothetical protein VF525_08860 [Pyrinomonadaceae bacterium]|jgi:hypothetical protein